MIRALRRAGHRRKRAQRESLEAYIADYLFPASLEEKLGLWHPDLADSDMALIERGLREWLTCCLWREGTQLGMPSRLVDEAWHELMLSSIAYVEFCERIYGEYLHHTPDADMEGSSEAFLENTVRAWDRSFAARRGESVIWDLDSRLGLEFPRGIGSDQLGAIRARYAAGGEPGWFGEPAFAGGAEGGVSCGGGCGGGGG
jgi:hypothetical protein